jgi:hypothetical protein
VHSNCRMPAKIKIRHSVVSPLKLRETRNSTPPDFKHKNKARSNIFAASQNHYRMSWNVPRTSRNVPRTSRNVSKTSRERSGRTNNDFWTFRFSFQDVGKLFKSTELKQFHERTSQYSGKFLIINKKFMRLSKSDFSGLN